MYEDPKPKVQAFQVNPEDYAPLVKRIAYHMMARMPASVQLDDLIQAGMLGLLEACQKYDGTKGASFETYAGIRIRGSIVDEMRRGDWAPRSVHRNARRVADAINKVEKRTSRDAQDQEIADELEVDISDYHNMIQDTAGSRLFSLDEAFEGDEGRVSIKAASEGLAEPLDSLERQDLKKSLVQAITQLPERERLVLALYYDEELNLKEIGQILGVSESRVSQIHSQAAARLRSKLSVWQESSK